MQFHFTAQAKKSYRKLHPNIQKKADKQLVTLLQSPKHPSLRVKKMKDKQIWEARIDYQYRITFIIQNDNLYILTLGPHDEGLGKQ